MNGVQLTQVRALALLGSITDMDRDLLVEETLVLLDERGLPDLSMRAVASALGVQPSALYWHVKSKQELLGFVADRILAEAEDADSLEGQVRSLRDALLAHRDGAELVASSIALGMGGKGLRAKLLGAAAREGVTETDRLSVVEALALILLGHTQLEQQRSQAEAIGIAMGDDEGRPDLGDLVRLVIGAV